MGTTFLQISLHAGNPAWAPWGTPACHKWVKASHAHPATLSEQYVWQNFLGTEHWSVLPECHNTSYFLFLGGLPTQKQEQSSLEDFFLQDPSLGARMAKESGDLLP